MRAFRVLGVFMCGFMLSIQLTVLVFGEAFPHYKFSLWKMIATIILSVYFIYTSLTDHKE